MRSVQLLNATKQSVLGTRIGVADTRWTRLRGLLGRPAPEPGEGLMIVPCRAVHMYGMRYPLDVVFFDRTGVVVATYANLAPRQRSGWHRTAQYAVELPPGSIAASRTEQGDKLVWLPTEPGREVEEPPSHNGRTEREDQASPVRPLRAVRPADFAQEKP